MPNDTIRIEELELRVRIGVAEAERREPQRITASLALEPVSGFRELQDDLSRTVDYAAVCAELERFVSDRADRLLETLADAVAVHLLRTFPLRAIDLELRKFVLPQTRHVAVRVVREA